MASDNEFEGGYNPPVSDEYWYDYNNRNMDQNVEEYYNLLLRLEDPRLSKDDRALFNRQKSHFLHFLKTRLSPGERRMFLRTLADYRRNRRAFVSSFKGRKQELIARNKARIQDLRNELKAAKEQLKQNRAEWASDKHDTWARIQSLPDNEGIPDLRSIYTGELIQPAPRPRRFGPARPTRTMMKKQIQDTLDWERSVGLRPPLPSHPPPKPSKEAKKRRRQNLERARNEALFDDDDVGFHIPPSEPPPPASCGMRRVKITERYPEQELHSFEDVPTDELRTTYGDRDIERWADEAVIWAENRVDRPQSRTIQAVNRLSHRLSEFNKRRAANDPEAAYSREDSGSLIRDARQRLGIGVRNQPTRMEDPEDDP